MNRNVGKEKGSSFGWGYDARIVANKSKLMISDFLCIRV